MGRAYQAEGRGVQRPRGRNELGAVKVQPEGLGGQNRVSERRWGQGDLRLVLLPVLRTASGCGVERGLSGAREVTGDGRGLGWADGRVWGLQEVRVHATGSTEAWGRPRNLADQVLQEGPPGQIAGSSLS